MVFSLGVRSYGIHMTFHYILLIPTNMAPHLPCFKHSLNFECPQHVIFSIKIINMLVVWVITYEFSKFAIV